MNKLSINIEKFQSQLDEWKAQVAQLEAKAGQANADAKLEYQREVDDLKSKYAEAEKQFEEIRKAQQSASSDVMDGMTSAWRDLGDGVKKAMQRFG